MAVVDALLKLVAVRGADGLIMQTGEVPMLLKGSEEWPLRMPVPNAEMFDAMLHGITSSAERERLARDGSVRTRYTADDNTTFTAEVTQAAEGYRVAFEPHDAVGQPTSAPQLALPPLATSSRALSSPALIPAKAGGAVIAGILDQAAAVDASDIFLSTSAAPRMRVGGQLQTAEGQPIDGEALLSFLRGSMAEGAAAALERDGSCDLAVGDGGRRYRVNLFRQTGGLAAAFRPIRRTPPTLSGLNLPADFEQLTSHRSGLVLLVGTAGSGKSTTLAALIEHLNRSVDKHIITLEDPIEYLYRSQRCLVHQREVGRHVASFSAGLRAALRESPDVILLGEMRDHETIAAALTAAETGHLVLSTLHSGSAAMAIDRIIDVFPQHQQPQVRYQLAEVLRAVVTQHLLPSTRAGQRIPAFEKLAVTRAVATKIREQRTHQIETELQKGRAEGMVPLERSLAQLVRKGLITAGTAHGLAGDPVYLDQLIHGR